ncbi:hypothetical protein HPB48_013494 [Haemaphysalis longicornis]|uniref:PH domain-containing protein n=1 Tax=Haemaphysalis longicornis TaxID=44386 RepID=A0A9J6GIX3_HAELO|nr:hypothetical protein HPB48_013494 [Haemaphysalis longicornis]
MIADGVKVDGSWELCIHITDLKLDRKLRVKGDMHIGGVMLNLVESLNVPTDWSDHALWWPEQNIWLTRTKSTLDQCGVMADALLHFTPMHKTLRVQFPDLRIMDRAEEIAQKWASEKRKKEAAGTEAGSPSEIGSRPAGKAGVRKIQKGETGTPAKRKKAKGTPGLLFFVAMLKKERLQLANDESIWWLDSSLSLMEQDVREFDLLQLRYKFYAFYDLNPRKDALQVNLQANSSQPDFSSQGEDDIDTALTDLQVTLEGSAITSETSNITQVPELHSYLRFLKPKRFTLKGFKRMFFIFKETRMCIYKSREEYEGGGSPSYVINLKGSEVTPDVYLAQGKYGIRLEVPGPEGMTEYWLRCETEDQYAQWMAGCRLAAKGKTMADSSYDAEVNSIQQFLQLQRPARATALVPSQLDIDVDDFVAPRFIKKMKSKQAIVQRIVEAHGNVKDLGLIEAKMNFIKAWQALPEFGISLFVVRFTGNKKEELLGVAFNRLMRMELSTGDHLKTWRFNTMMAWNVNWEVKQMNVQFEEDQRVAFACLSADCKTVHEFIGGYIFLSMRSKDQNQALNEELFHKLTGGVGLREQGGGGSLTTHRR